MATFNGERYLRKQLESIYGQTYSNIEVIVTDDASSDTTQDILDEYKISHGLRYYINETNIGFKKNFEKAVSYCVGEYIAFADQDDIWLSQKLQVLIDNIGTNDLVCSNASLIDENDQVLCESLMEKIKLKICKKEDMFAYFMFRNFVTGCTTLVRKSLIEKYSPSPDTEKYHDWWFAICASKNNGINYVVEPLVLYRQHIGQDTGAGIINKNKMVDMFSRVSRRLVGIKTERVEYAELQMKRLQGFLNEGLFDKSDRAVIKDAYNYYDSYCRSFFHPKSFFIGIKYSHLFYKNNYFYYHNYISDVIG